MHQILFWLCALEVFLNVMHYINPRFTYLFTYSAPDPTGGAVVLAAHSDLPAGFKGLTSKRKGAIGEKGMGRKGKRGEGRERGGNVEFDHLLLSNLTTGIVYTICLCV